MVVQRRVVKNSDVTHNLADIVRIVEGEARSHASDFEILPSGDVRQFFAEYGCHNKHAIAAQLAEWFDELSWKLPPKCKPWQSEDHNLTIFDAAATAMTFAWNRSGGTMP